MRQYVPVDAAREKSTTPHTGLQVSRRTLLQDLVRCHVVLIDEERRGKLWAFQSGFYEVAPGRHVVRLAPREAIDYEPGKASSANIDVEVASGEIRRLRTRGRGKAGYLPSLRDIMRLSFVPSAMYRRPWIVLV
jgi:hypothetical protein